MSGELFRLKNCRAAPRQEHIPAGDFWMGSTREEREYAYRLDHEITRSYAWYEKETRRKARTTSFCIDRFPTTNRQYKKFIDQTGHPAPSISKDVYRTQGFLVHPYEKFTEFLWRNGTFPPAKDEHPVVLVNHRDAEAYCAWVGNIAKQPTRLPTEAEWEKAARGTDARIFPWGNEWRSNALNSGDRFGSTTPVNQFPNGKSPYGLYDMAGNVFEWTASKWDDTKMVVKGCSWDDLPGTCRAAMRHGRPFQSKHILIGFRCVSD